MARERGLGKCEQNHAGSFGYPTRPEEPYPFCPQCGGPMVWSCAGCDAAIADDSSELALAMFCRHCGARYFPEPADEAHQP